MAGEGKRWEANIKKSLGDKCIRLYDTTNGFSGVKNPCDFIYYSYPNRIMIEAKSIKGKRLPFNDITENQWEQLDFHSHQFGVIAGVAVEFRELHECYFIPMQVLVKMRDEGHKSISQQFCESCLFITNLHCKYARTNCIFDVKQFNQDVKYRAVKLIETMGVDALEITNN